jgi:hypothetical protein
MNSIRPAIEELERMYKAFVPLFWREMPVPVITIQSKGRRKAMGWHSPAAWRNADPGELGEINVAAEYLDQSIEDTAEKMLHEMVHRANALDGIRDYTLFMYHNRKFKVGCDKIGLVCEKDAGHGWAQTSLSDALRAKVQALNINGDAFSLFRVERETAKTKMLKWQCSCTTIRTAIELDATCNKCGLKFKLRRTADSTGTAAALQMSGRQRNDPAKPT